MNASSAPPPNSPPKTKVRHRRHRWRPFFWRWHRRLGVAAAVIVLLVSITGLMLNHTSELQFSSLSVRQGWLLSHYGMSMPDSVSYRIDDVWLSGDERHTLYWDGEPLGHCRGALKGVERIEDQWLVACAEELLIYTPAGELVERLGVSYGLPQPLDAIGRCDGSVCLRSGERALAVDLQHLNWTPMAPGQVDWLVSRQPPQPLQDKLQRSLGAPLNWERVLLDLHSGRILGQVGVWIVDMAALLLLFLALSGFWLWYQHLGRRR